MYIINDGQDIALSDPGYGKYIGIIAGTFVLYRWPELSSIPCWAGLIKFRIDADD